MLFRTKEWLDIRRSAGRIGLRDKGPIEVDGTAFYHAFCGTFLRIGIDRQNESVQYCWRCEHVTERLSDSEAEEGGDGPDGGETGQPETLEETADHAVVPFRHTRVA